MSGHGSELSPLLETLVHRFVDRMDDAEARGSAAPQTIALDRRTWPELYGAAIESDKEMLWEQLCTLVQKGWLAVTPPSAARHPEGYAMGPRVRLKDLPSLRAAVSRLERTKSPVEIWRAAVASHLQYTDEAKQIAGDYLIDIPGRSAQEVMEALNGLVAFSDGDLLLREVSARLFWGQSKVLDNREALVAALLERDECPFPAAPLQLQVYLPLEGFDAVLFIENVTTFEQAIRSSAPEFRRLALVFAAGFRGSARRLRSPELASLFVSRRGLSSGEAVERFERWLFAQSEDLPVCFWGDLDWAGMRILEALRSNFASVRA